MSTAIKRRAWRAEPLPRGRHGLSTRTVKDSQRVRLIQAMLERVNAQGYAKTTVSDVAAAARVSPNVFYKFFSDKEECFLAAVDQNATKLLDEMVQAAAGPDWVDNIQRGFAVYLRWWQQHPREGHAYLVEVPVVGPRAIAQRHRVLEPFTQMFILIAARARKDNPRLPRLSPFIPRMLALSVHEFIAAELRQERTDSLHEWHDDLAFYIVKMLADEATASKIRATRSGR